MILNYKLCALALTTALTLNACSTSRWASEDPVRLQARAQALAALVPMPATDQYQATDFEWFDAARSRAVPAKLYWPSQSVFTTQQATRQQAAGKESNRGKIPLIVFSHGLGGSRTGYTYLGKHWAANGFASLHLQHTASDRKVWSGNALEIYQNVQAAAKDEEALARAYDMRFALDQILQDARFAPTVDRDRIIAAGHSYGANTTMLVTGAKVVRSANGNTNGNTNGSANTNTINLRDERFRASILISAPPFYGEADFSPILQSITVPSLHITATGDDIQIPGYGSGAEDRVKVYQAMGSVQKTLVMFKDGSHSMFTDRLGTGGETLNPKVKAATQSITLAFLKSLPQAAPKEVLQAWRTQQQGIVHQIESSVR